MFEKLRRTMFDLIRGCWEQLGLTGAQSYSCSSERDDVVVLSLSDITRGPGLFAAVRRAAECNRGEAAGFIVDVQALSSGLQARLKPIITGCPGLLFVMESRDGRREVWFAGYAAGMLGRPRQVEIDVEERIFGVDRKDESAKS